VGESEERVGWSAEKEREKKRKEVPPYVLERESSRVCVACPGKGEGGLAPAH